ncbi:MAG: hypothetical protein MUE49_11220, partial [Rhodospirillales bacterium]|nr:hypothetical protein [Rhodospirillales bacterium]
GPGGGMMGPGGGRGAMMIEMYDADGDGRVTREEFLAGHAVRFEEMDVNKDGSVTFEEFTVTFKGRNPERARAAFQRLDANGSGAIDKGEYDAVAEIRFERIDINSDGVITREEIIAAMPMRGGGMPAQPMAPKPQ